MRGKLVMWTPTPDPSPQWGGERTAIVALDYIRSRGF